MGQPFTLRDTAVTTDVPAAMTGQGLSLLAWRLIVDRRLEPETYQVTQEAVPPGYEGPASHVPKYAPSTARQSLELGHADMMPK